MTKAMLQYATAVLVGMLALAFSVVPSASAEDREDDRGDDRKVVAVATVTIDHPTAQLYFREDSVRDVVTQSLHQAGGVKVIDWSRLSEVLFRRNLQWSDVVNDAERLEEIKDVLLNDYFLIGSISSFSERQEFKGGAFRKSKEQIVNVQLDLFLKDAITNEIVSSARSTAEQKRKVSQSLGFGASSGADPAFAYQVLNDAVDTAVSDLLAAPNEEVTQVE